MSEWQQADFGSDFLIPERNLTVYKCLPEEIAFNSISFWVREQGLVFAVGNINARGGGGTALYGPYRYVPL